MQPEIEFTTESQNQAIADYLKQGHTLTSLESWRLFGVSYLPARIADVKKKLGLIVVDKWIKVETRDGLKRVKEYSIAS